MKPHVRLAIMSNAAPEILKRAVASARHMIDSACILIGPKNYSALPKEGLADSGLETLVVQAPWQGFSTTRTTLLRCAEADPKVDWVLMLDADDVFAPGSTLPDLEAGSRTGCTAYQIPIDIRGYGYRWRWKRNGHLMAARRGFDWVGTGDSDRHELLRGPEGYVLMSHDGLVISNVYDPRAIEEAAHNPKPVSTGKRTYDEDAASLSPGTDYPTDPRAAFYYAQSLRDAGRNEEAYLAFVHRSRITGGAIEETFWSKLWLAKLAPYVARNPVPLYVDAMQHSPHRAEPPYALSAHYRSIGDDDLAHHFGKLAAACAYPVHAQLYVECHAYHPSALRAVGIQP